MTMYSVDRRGEVVRYVPDLAVLDDYQVTVSRQTLYDEGGETVAGKPALEYMHDGIVEELAEPWEIDPLHVGYSRTGALLSGLNGFSAGEVSASAVELHQKEFGDISWYMANRLALQGIRLALTVERAEEDRADSLAYPADTAELMNAIEELFPGLMFAIYSVELRNASREAIDMPDRQRLNKLSIAAGRLVLSMCQVVAVKLDTTYEAVLVQNVAKIENRMKNGTIFDKSGGDAR